MRRSLAVLILAACAREPARTAPPAEPPVVAADVVPAAVEPAATPVENDPRWHSALQAIAAGYQAWGKVDDENRWAPFLCRMPTPASAHISRSGDESTHGRKLYTLHAKDPVAYGAQPTMNAMPTAEQPGLSDISQVLVKEAFKPVETDQAFNLHLRPAADGGKLYLPGEPLGLYVLFKPREAEPTATDAGWVYGTIAADGTITGAGKIDSCMRCHRSRPDRLFGLQKSAPR